MESQEPALHCGISFTGFCTHRRMGELYPHLDKGFLFNFLKQLHDKHKLCVLDSVSASQAI